jgi:hypothetical protein
MTTLDALVCEMLLCVMDYVRCFCLRWGVLACVSGRGALTSVCSSLSHNQASFPNPKDLKEFVQGFRANRSLRRLMFVTDP